MLAGLRELIRAGPMLARASSALARGAGGARGRFTVAPGIRPPPGAAPRGVAAGRVPGAASWQRPGRGGEAKALAKGAPGRPVSAAAGALLDSDKGLVEVLEVRPRDVPPLPASTPPPPARHRRRRGGATRERGPKAGRPPPTPPCPRPRPPPPGPGA